MTTLLEQALIQPTPDYEPTYAAIPVHRAQQFDVQHGVCLVDGEFVRIMKESKR